MSKKIYIIGSMRNPNIPVIGNKLRAEGYDVFDDWHAVGPEADDHWQAYEKAKGHNYAQALEGKAAENVFNFDKTNLDNADICVLVMPAGKSGHMELGYMVGKGKPCFILFEEDPERFDIMTRFVFTTGGAVVYSYDELVKRLALLTPPVILHSSGTSIVDNVPGSIMWYA